MLPCEYLEPKINQKLNKVYMLYVMLYPSKTNVEVDHPFL